jgi:hypothetical protein
MRPAGPDEWDEDRSAELVTRDSMVGTGMAVTPEELLGSDQGMAQNLGGMMGFGRFDRNPANRSFTPRGKSGLWD